MCQKLRFFFELIFFDLIFLLLSVFFDFLTGVVYSICVLILKISQNIKNLVKKYENSKMALNSVEKRCAITSCQKSRTMAFGKKVYRTVYRSNLGSF